MAWGRYLRLGRNGRLGPGIGSILENGERTFELVRRLRAGWSIDPLQIETGRQIQRQFQTFTVGHFLAAVILFKFFFLNENNTSATRH